MNKAKIRKFREKPKGLTEKLEKINTGVENGDN